MPVFYLALRVVDGRRTSIPFDYAWRFQMGAAESTVHVAAAAMPLVCSGCAKDANDSAWELVDVPHDYIVTLPVNESCFSGGGYFPRRDAVYRKHFVVPDLWRGDRISIHFEGVYKTADIFVNGRSVTIPHADSSHAYTGFDVRLDTLGTDGISYGSSDPNVIAVSVDGSYGTEHWYAGAGIYRSVHLVRTSLTHIQPESIYTPAIISSPRLAVPHAHAAAATTTHTADATVAPLLQVVNEAATSATVTVSVRILDYDGMAVVGKSSSVLTLAAGVMQTVHTPSIPVTAAALWSIQSPHLYRAQCTLLDATGKVLDEVNSTFGIRGTHWDANRGFSLNGEAVKIRGFCHHDDFTGVGMAMPDRISLLRVMQTRALGGNAWRMSHNNYRSSVYDLLDAAGVVVWDENRDLTASGLSAMASMVTQHRNHPSVLMYVDPCRVTQNTMRHTWLLSVLVRKRPLQNGRL